MYSIPIFHISFLMLILSGTKPRWRCVQLCIRYDQWNFAAGIWCGWTFCSRIGQLVCSKWWTSSIFVHSRWVWLPRHWQVSFSPHLAISSWEIQHPQYILTVAFFSCFSFSHLPLPPPIPEVENMITYLFSVFDLATNFITYNSLNWLSIILLIQAIQRSLDYIRANPSIEAQSDYDQHQQQPQYYQPQQQQPQRFFKKRNSRKI